jgi:hypothetical protein
MSFLDNLLSEAVSHPVYTALLTGAVFATVGAYVTQRRDARMLGVAEPPSNVRVLRPDGAA